MTDRLLILGANGMLGSSLIRYFYSKTTAKVFGSVRSTEIASEMRMLGLDCVYVSGDVTDFENVSSLIESIKPTVVFNCIGVIKQLDNAKLPVPSLEINSLLPHKLASLCSKLGSRFIHFSTDCVFSGRKGNYSETELPDPPDLYGRSKLLGEVDYGGHLTLRTSIIGHEIKSKNSLIDWFLGEENQVSGYAGAVFSGLPTVCIAEFLHLYVLPAPSLSGLYHLSAEPIDKFSLLGLVKSVYGKQVTIVKSGEYILDRSLNSSALRLKTGFKPKKWIKLVECMHAEYDQYFNKN